MTTKTYTPEIDGTVRDMVASALCKAYEDGRPFGGLSYGEVLGSLSDGLGAAAEWSQIDWRMGRRVGTLTAHSDGTLVAFC